MPHTRSSRLSRVALLLTVLAASYVALGRLGLLLAVPPGYATAIFPPAGIAVASMFVLGTQSLPAAFVGSLVLNAWIGRDAGLALVPSLESGLVIAAASTLQAAAGGSVLRRAVGYPAPLDSARDIALFLFLTPVICLISGTLSLAGLYSIGVVQAPDLLPSWLTWWIGDTLGVLIVVPMFLVLAGEPRTLWRRRARLVALPMLLFFALFVAIFVRVSKWEEQQSLLEFRLEAQHLGDTMLTDLEQLGTVLDQLKSAFEARAMPVSRQNFAEMVSVVSRRFPTVQAIEWAPRVSDDDRQAFERAQRDSYPFFAIRDRDRRGTIHSAQAHVIYYPVTYLVPAAGNGSAVGFDLLSDQERREAIDAANATNGLAATAPLRLVQEHGNEAGILLVDSVPSGATGPGVVLIALRMGTFVRAELGHNVSSIHARLIDVGAKKDLFDTLPADAKALGVRHFEFGGRRYVLSMTPAPSYLGSHRGWQSWIFLVAGVVGTGLIGALLMLGSGQTWRFETLLEARTGDLRLSHQRLREEMAERERAHAALQQSQRMKAIGQLTGGIAHDFNNLLMVVGGSVERLRRDPAGQKAVHYLDMIAAATQRAESLTRQLLSFAQLRPLKPRVVDMTALTRSACEMIRQSLRGDIEVRLIAEEEGLAACIDPGEFDLALLNLAVNAQDAMPNGGILTVCAERASLHDAIDGVSGDCVAIRVSDTGSGISAEILPRVFEPFFTTKEIGKGTGLGLSQVYGFAKQSGGAVTVTSEPGKGATITLYLPVGTSVPHKQILSVDDTPSRAGGRQALVIEDDAGVAEILVAQLEELGHHVELVGNGRAALDAIEERKYDLVVSDVLMPGGVNGFDLARQIRERFPHIAILLVTGHGGSDAESQHEDFVVLRKPFDIRSLAEALTEVRERSNKCDSSLAANA